MRIPFELDPHSMKASLRFDQLRLSTLPTFHREEHFWGTATETIDSRRQHRYECSAAWNRGVYTRDLDARPRLRIAFVHWERKRMRGVSKYLRANISRARRGQHDRRRSCWIIWDPFVRESSTTHRRAHANGDAFSFLLHECACNWALV